MKNNLNIRYLVSKKNANQPIIKALLKYGPSNFSVVIIEYTPLDVLFEIESFWIIKLKPYYNVLQYGGTSVGYKHSEAIKKMLSTLAKTRTHSEETKASISASLKGDLNPFKNKSHTEESLGKMIAANSLGVVYVYDCFKQLQVIFPSVTTMAKLIKSNSSTINKVINSGE